MSSSTFVPPAHGNLLPGEMRFAEDATTLWWALLPELGIEHAHRAEHHGQSGLCGYYKIQTTAGALLFAKVKPPWRAEREALGAEVSTWLFQQGASTLPLQYPPQQGPAGEWIFLYPWLESRFFDESQTQVQNLGRALAFLHNQLARFPVDAGESKSLLDSWKAQLQRVPVAAFVREYKSSLSLVEPVFSSLGSCWAHNDLHRANVLFNTYNHWPTFLDFEDLVGVRSSVLVDVAAVIERFCFWPEVDVPKARLFLAHYLAGQESAVALSAAELVQVGLCRCFHSLTILQAVRDPENPVWGLEVAKFENLIACWQRWEGPLRRALAEI